MNKNVIVNIFNCENNTRLFSINSKRHLNKNAAFEWGLSMCFKLPQMGPLKSLETEAK